jgi:hypothetical protein
MENQNVTQTNPQGGDLLNFNKAFKDYQNNQNKGQRQSKSEILAKYFVPRNSKEIFRILPYKTEKFHADAFFHVVTTNIAGGLKKHNSIIYCPAHNDPKVPKLDETGNPVFDANGKQVMIPAHCPLCDKYKKILATQDSSIKYIKKENMDENQKIINEKNKLIFIDANKWEAKKFYIVKGIDKGAEKDGVKFWRFKHNFKNQGTLDQLYPVLSNFVSQNKVSFADPINGTDLEITMVDTKGFNNRVYKAITAIIAKGKSVLHADQVIANDWINDNTTWRNVFKPKNAPGISSHQFLELIVEGNSPYWEDTDASKKHWVFPGHPDLELAANTRNRDLDADTDENFEYASDLEDDETPQVTNNFVAQNIQSQVTNVTESTPTSTQDTPVVSSNPIEDDTEVDDLPF